MRPYPLIHQPNNDTAPIKPDPAGIPESIVTLYPAGHPTHLGIHRSGNGFATEHVGDCLQIDESSSRLELVEKSSLHQSQAFGQSPHSTADIVKRIFV